MARWWIQVVAAWLLALVALQLLTAHQLVFTDDPLLFGGWYLFILASAVTRRADGQGSILPPSAQLLHALILIALLVRATPWTRLDTGVAMSWLFTFFLLSTTGDGIRWLLQALRMRRDRMMGRAA